MICVTGSERSLDALERRVSTHRHLLQEVRLDLLSSIDDTTLALLRSPRIIATCRRRDEGGAFRGSEADRYDLLRRALDQRPGYLDLEASTPPELLGRFLRQRGDTRLVLSWHPPVSQRDPFAVTPPVEADLFKVACHVEDAADLLSLWELGRRRKGKLIGIGMGPAGLLSRALYHRFGSPWTYVVPDAARPTAPGQLTLSQAKAWRIEGEENLTPIGLLGGEGVMGSPGPAVYNHLFHRRGLPFIYLPVVTGQPERILLLLERLGFGGCSVTMPLKETVADLVDQEPPADAITAVNTISWRDRRWRGMNTDVAALTTLLAPHRGRPALILGTGGAAIAAAHVLVTLGSEVVVTGRSAERAEVLARRVPGCRTLSWEDRGAHPFRVLVNATPCGVDGRSDPMPPDVEWGDRVVLDAVLSGRPTPLVRRVRRSGGLAIEGRLWWLHQGSLQMTSLTGRPITTDELQEALDDA